MAEIVIRNVKKEDLEKVVDIQIDGWRTAYHGIVDNDYLESMDKNEYLEKRKNDYQKNGFIVAMLEKEIVGFCRYTTENQFFPEYAEVDCELSALYVKSDRKGQGIGTKLIEYVMAEFRKLGRKKMILLCFQENLPSRKFYEKMGGKVLNYRTENWGNKEYQVAEYIFKL